MPIMVSCKAKPQTQGHYRNKRNNNMSSIGARSAEIYVMEKRQKEKMKRMEEERVRRGEVSVEERKVGSYSAGKNKVHPGSEQGATTGGVNIKA
ncbi:hypothetical protein VNO77_43884 [Canavalia gladiata]|uniref:Uncharacterized protein n=1 Tax=Canavalia gladiata TaxID=3824 RepID=A0AAN9JUY0_CANGL